VKVESFFKSELYSRLRNANFSNKY